MVGIWPIPAGTGETIARKVRHRFSRAYPRRHGGNDSHRIGLFNCAGLSPQARGKRALNFAEYSSSGPIPAGTGETGRKFLDQILPRAYPRRHGGNIALSGQIPKEQGLSPQARGKLARNIHVNLKCGPIPAGTGETV